jgi:hypothetical protein
MNRKVFLPIYKDPAREPRGRQTPRRFRQDETHFIGFHSTIFQQIIQVEYLVQTRSMSRLYKTGEYMESTSV